MKTRLQMRAIIMPILMMLFAQPGKAQSSALKWEAAIGGNNDDRGYSMVQARDGGYAIVGRTNSYSNAYYSDVYVVKLDSAGNLEWTRTIGGKNDDQGNSIIQTKDGGYAITGSTNSYGDTINGDAYVIKLDSAGNIKWTETIGGPNIDYGSSIIQTKDGGYAITGGTNSYGAGTFNGAINVYVVRLDSSGKLKWTTTIGGTDGESGSSIVQTKDGGYAIVGNSNTFGTPNTYVIKLDSAGNLNWTKAISRANDSGQRYANYGNSLIQSADGGYAIAGSSYPYLAMGGFPEADIIKLDSAGNLNWIEIIGGANSTMVSSIVQTQDKGYFITGTTGDTSNLNAYVIKLDSSGKLKWTRIVGGAGKEAGYFGIQTKDGGYAVTGYTDSYGNGGKDVYVVKLDSTGGTCNDTNSFGNIVNTDSIFMTTGGTVSSGGSISSRDSGIVNSVGVHTDICGVASVETITSEKNSLNVYPNPSNGLFKLEIKNYELGINNTVDVYNVLGEKACSQFVIRNSQFVIDLSNSPAGVYFVKVVSGKEVYTQKLMLVK